MPTSRSIFRTARFKTTFNGPFAAIDPAVALADSRFKASATGSANVRVTVQELLRRSLTAADYDIEGTLALESSTVRGVEIAAAHIDGAFRNATATLRHLDATGPAFDIVGSGSIPFSCAELQACDSNLDYDVKRADLAQARHADRERRVGPVFEQGTPHRSDRSPSSEGRRSRSRT